MDTAVLAAGLAVGETTVHSAIIKADGGGSWKPQHRPKPHLLQRFERQLTFVLMPLDENMTITGEHASQKQRERMNSCAYMFVNAGISLKEILPLAHVVSEQSA
jgi:hypothetical protein